MSPSKTALCTCLLISLATVAVATESDLRQCRNLAAPELRLACYDAIELPTAVPAAAVAATAAKPAVPATARLDSFGLPAVAESAPDFIDSQITGSFEGWEPRSVFTLANGQRWRVTDGSQAMYRLKDPKVRIRRGLLGAFYLEIPGTSANVRVRRMP